MAAQKKLEAGSKYASFDKDGDGIVTDEDSPGPTVTSSSRPKLTVTWAVDVTAPDPATPLPYAEIVY